MYNDSIDLGLDAFQETYRLKRVVEDLQTRVKKLEEFAGLAPISDISVGFHDFEPSSQHEYCARCGGGRLHWIHEITQTRKR